MGKLKITNTLPSDGVYVCTKPAGQQEKGHAPNNEVSEQKTPTTIEGK